MLDLSMLDLSMLDLSMLDLSMLDLWILVDASEDGNQLLRGLPPSQRLVWYGYMEFQLCEWPTRYNLHESGVC
jgi:hypothetical protein